MMRKLFLSAIGVVLMGMPAAAWGFEVYRNGDVSLSISYWAQAWYQRVDGYDKDGDGDWDDDVDDFMLRRTYLSLQGTITPSLSFFMHYAGDRIGQDGLSDASLGLGSGLALRDGWVVYKLSGDDLMVKAGRMYIPFTRNYGTTSTKALLTTDLDWGQGGLRSGIFYPGKVGRDDGVTVWGNILEDRLQYRLMVGEGVENDTENPDDNLRFAGRLSYNFLDAETGWFKQETYLGKKRILAIGGGFDRQNNLVIGGGKMDYSAYTIDLHLEFPVGATTFTSALSFTRIDNSVNGITWSDVTSGSDGDVFTSKAGLLLSDRFQPFAHFQAILPDVSGSENTHIYGLGCNYYIKGPANKLTAEWTRVDYDAHDIDLITVQAAFGF
ncbi:MAG: selenite/tellurite reduction operon porin ExtI [Desulfobacterales bacterium]